jgi:hypothetical protein
MGMFDHVYVSAEAVAALPLSCQKCGRHPSAESDWQTKSLSSCMDSYFLRHDDDGAVRLYLLDPPSDRHFWHQWTDEEIAESERASERGSVSAAFFRKRAGEGCFLPEAFLPLNRRQRFMGELPHQWVEIYHTCECGEWVERWIKFSDGVVNEVRSERPRVEPGADQDSDPAPASGTMDS